MRKKVKKELKKHLSGLTLLFAILFLAAGVAGGFIGYKLLNKEGNTKIELSGEELVVINLGEEYKEEGFTFVIDDVDYSNDVNVNGNVDTDKEGTYIISYTLSKDDHEITLVRVVKVLGGGANGN